MGRNIFLSAQDTSVISFPTYMYLQYTSPLQVAASN